MINTVIGDLFKAQEDIIGHQVNCMGVMGSGVAVQVKRKFPEVFKEYENLVKSRSSQSNASPVNDLLGECQIVNTANGKYVANLFGQYDYNRSLFSKKMTDESSLERSLESLKRYAQGLSLSVALPYKIGSDRGGADWDEVYKIIEKVFSDYEVTLYRLAQ